MRSKATPRRRIRAALGIASLLLALLVSTPMMASAKGKPLPSPDGSGTMTASPTSVASGTAGNTIILTYTAAAGGTQRGAINVVVPTGWSAPSTIATAPGYTTSSAGTVTVSGQTIIVSNLTLKSGSLTITYGDKALGGPGAQAPASAGSAQWVTTEKSTNAGTLTALAVSPTVTVVPEGTALAIFAGTGTAAPIVNGTPASNAGLDYPGGVAVGPDGSVYIADTFHNAIDKVDTSGNISIFAGGFYAPQPTPGPATSSGLNWPYGVAVDASGNVYIADSFNDDIEKVTPSGNLTWIAGQSCFANATPGPATATCLSFVGSIVVDNAGNIYFAESNANRIDKIDTLGILSFVAGSGVAGTPTPGPAIASALNIPYGVNIDAAGNLYIADTFNNEIEKVDTAGILSVIAGNGTAGVAAPGPATSSSLNRPEGVAADASGNVYVADFANSCVEKVDTTGILSFFAGTCGTFGNPTAGPAANSLMYSPETITIANGDVWIADEASWWGSTTGFIYLIS